MASNAIAKTAAVEADVLACFKDCSGWFMEPILTNSEAPNLNVAPHHFEVDVIDRHTIRKKDERLNKFLYDFDPDDNFYYYDKNISSIDHGDQSCNSRILYKQMQEIESWYY